MMFVHNKSRTYFVFKTYSNRITSVRVDFKFITSTFLPLLEEIFSSINYRGIKNTEIKKIKQDIGIYKDNHPIR